MNIEGVEIEIIKTNRRKTTSIFIERDGSVRVLAPASVADDKIEEAVRSKQYLIFEKLAKWKELNKGKVERRFVNGQSFLYLGSNYPLSIVEEQDVPLKISRGYFMLDKRYLAKAENFFKAFYKEKGAEKILERYRLISEGFQQRPSSIRVMELRNRWASRTTKNALLFHWKCAMAPVSVIDYIITHEMVHLKFPNHSPQFWDDLDKKMPGYREQADWLKNNGVRLSI